MATTLLTTRAMRDADARTIAAGTPGYTLMQRAGAAVAEKAAQLAGSPARKIIVLCGPGNNGGDGFVAARLLVGRGFTVRLALMGAVAALKGDAAAAAADWQGEVLSIDDVTLNDADVIIDALLGAGLDRDLTAELQALVARVNASPAAVVAVDVPTGIDGDSGAVRGAAVQATLTVTFARAKPGHYLFPGRACRGDLHVADIGIADVLADELSNGLTVNGPGLFGDSLPVPSVTGHKYGRGHALVVSGGRARTGAARLAARAALRIGAGLVTVASPADALAENAAHLTAIMLRPVEDAAQLAEALADERFNALVIGPAAGVGERTRAFVAATGAAGRALVLDADALTSFAGDVDSLRAAIGPATRRGVVLTPHEGEFARLFAQEAAVASARSKLTRAQHAAQRTGAVVVIKGADTVIAAPDGRAAINDNGSPWLATAGSGDVLAGMIAGALAQGVPAFEAACAGVWLHGAAAQLGGAGLIAEDLPELLPRVLPQVLKPLEPLRKK
ncbi:hydroxyethylthiazole kinase-like uncharacterized protein yjeF [Pseudochelatococcus lubricantis]|uniref:Bifunctional NAD(P)H-hydrate repair enzyme n=1 Tax=Pseudochelatococcus lubricantis TaxID=1538102 RepID=A0ABX0UTK9_9HYPH|nr:NAD(P)H-hydrate dehydratase [Pseudochelatococcus lubricantis]NIJ56298.1 hydroxyethylthiazole kinase-like uncharacterized protein yjeF [Pseudochelatococcus lubricantis]